MRVLTATIAVGPVAFELGGDPAEVGDRSLNEEETSRFQELASLFEEDRGTFQMLDHVVREDKIIGYRWGL